MRKTKIVNSLANTEFWYGMFKPRSKEWQQSTLARLKAKVSHFETAEENHDKQVALSILLGE